MDSFDQLHRFIFPQASVRGEIVRLDKTVQRVVDAQPYPLAVKKLLTELLAATSLLTATLKLKGEISLQLQSEGALKYVVVHGSDEQELRGVAKWEGEIDDIDLQTMLPKGIMAINIIPDQGERYQGIVALDKATLAECLEGYFEQSEQLPTKISLTSTVTDEANLVVGSLLQVLPNTAASSQQKQNEDFERICMLANTLTSEEAFLLPVEEILHRLYHQEELELFAPEKVQFKCTCSKEKCASALAGMQKQELLDIIAQEEAIKMNCQYCHQEYKFDQVDVEALFANTDGSSSVQ